MDELIMLEDQASSIEHRQGDQKPVLRSVEA